MVDDIINSLPPPSAAYHSVLYGRLVLGYHLNNLCSVWYEAFAPISFVYYLKGNIAHSKGPGGGIDMEDLYLVQRLCMMSQERLKGWKLRCGVMSLLQINYYRP